jgi:hypothetical protein
LDFDYITGMTTENMSVTIDGAKILFAGKPYFESGHFTATYTAPTTKNITVLWGGKNPTGGGNGDFALDNLSFVPASPNASTAFTNGPTANPDTLSYTGGALDALGSNDTITATSSSLQATLAAGGMIDGGAGADTLKLAAGTVLNLDALDRTQTVRPIQEVEILQMQGTSSLTLSANNVLSLGGSNATTMAGYTFSTTTGGTASASSTGKVQMVITGTASDALVLSPLSQDGVTTNGILGNTGLGGQWDDMGTTVIGGVTYKVYNHSTTQAQVLTTVNPTVLSNAIAFSSMTKDSGVTSSSTINNNWITNDTSAGRLISGTVATPLASGDVVKVYANGTLIGNATVNAAGTAWEITDTNGYNASWVYSANIVSASGTSTTAYQPVNVDLSEAAPVITGVFDNVSTTTIANNGTTNNTLSTVKGTGVAGDTVYLYDNNYTTLVGTAVVDGSGNWSVTSLTGVLSGSNTFAAKQVDAQGNQSVLSNQWTVTVPGTNLFSNGDFSAGNTGFTTDAGYQATNVNGSSSQKYMIDTKPANSTATPLALTTSSTTNFSLANGSGNWYDKTVVSLNPEFDAQRNDAVASTFLSLASGNYMYGSLDGLGSSTAPATVWSNTMSVVAGTKYLLSFDYWSGWFKDVSTAPAASRTALDVVIDGQVIMSTIRWSAGQVFVEYTPTTTKTISVALETYSDGPSADFRLDNLKFAQAAPANTLTTAGPTANPDTLSYTGGALDALGSNDTITATSTSLQTTLAAGGMINGGAGVDTFKLVAGTTLDLTALNDIQTVKPIEQIEVFELLGSSSLVMSANDVLSLGGANASTMAAYSFASTTQTATDSGVQATGSTSSTGKVQFVVNGTSTDNFWLDALNTDGVTTNGVVGNTGLSGQWDYKGTANLTVGGVTQLYKVYNHSTTQAQVLVDADINASTDDNLVSITSVKASGTTTKVITETFDNLPYTNREMDSFTTNNGLTFKQDFNAPSFTIGADGTGVNGVGRALIMNNVNVPANVNQWSVTTPTGVSSATANYWDLSTVAGGSSLFFNAPTNAEDLATIVNMTVGGTAAAPLSVTSTTTSTIRNEIAFAGMPADKYFLDNLQVRVDGIAETADLASGGVTRFTTGTVNGTLATPLLAGQYVQVFSNGVSLGNATVSGTSWTISDTIASGGESYTAKVMNANGSQVTASNSYAINQAASSTPKLTITDDTASAVGTGVSVNFTFQFDQAVTGFTDIDVVVTNGGVKGPLIQLDAKTWVMSINTPNSGAGNMTVSVADGSFTATTGGASGSGSSATQAYDVDLTRYYFNGWGVGGATVGSTAAPLTTGPADDVIYAVGQSTNGAESIDLGAGNDYLEIWASNVSKLALATGNASFDGGAGDRLNMFSQGVTFDLTNVNTAANLKNFESIDITGNGNNIVKLNLNTVLNMSDIADNPATTANEGSMLVINGNAGDTVQLVGGINWTTVTTGVSGATLAATYGAGYAFAAADTYREMSYNGTTLFIDEAMTRTDM